MDDDELETAIIETEDEFTDDYEDSDDDSTYTTENDKTPQPSPIVREYFYLIPYAILGGIMCVLLRACSSSPPTSEDQSA